MDKKRIREIVISYIERSFPEYTGVEPDIQEEVVRIEDASFAKAGMVPIPPKKVYVAVFKKEIIAEDGGKIKKVLRTTLDEKGRIIKTTHSK